MFYVPLIDPDQVRKHLTDYVTTERIRHQIYWDVAGIVSSHAGREIGDYLADQLRALLQNYIVRIMVRNRCYYLEVYGQSIPFDYKLSFIIGHKDTNDQVDPGFFELYNRPPDVAGLKRIEDLLNNPDKIERMALTWNLAQQTTEELKREANAVGYPYTIYFH